jgi:large subunit ribosomal protein L4
VQVEIVNKELKKVGVAELNDSVFGLSSAPYLWHELVKWQLAGKRQGTAKTKQRNEVSGSTRKIYRQKGTGRARHGSRKAPIFVGGGQTFGPQPRSYAYTIPKSMKRKALCSALSMKIAKSCLTVVDELNVENGKTKAAVALLKPFAAPSAIVVDLENNSLKRAVRNLPDFKYLRPEGLNVYDLMRFERLIITKRALSQLEGIFSHERA